MTTEPQRPLEREPEHRGSLWTHPYMLYVLLTMVLFVVLLILGWLAVSNDWIPNRGVHS